MFKQNGLEFSSSQKLNLIEMVAPKVTWLKTSKRLLFTVVSATLLLKGFQLTLLEKVKETISIFENTK